MVRAFTFRGFPIVDGELFAPPPDLVNIVNHGKIGCPRPWVPTKLFSGRIGRIGWSAQWAQVGYVRRSALGPQMKFNRPH